MHRETLKDNLENMNAQLDNLALTKSLMDKNQKITQLEIKVDILEDELNKERTYYKGINDLLDKLSTAKGDPHRVRVALQILDLRDRKLSLKKVERGES